jgi:hypothetical protein
VWAGVSTALLLIFKNNVKLRTMTAARKAGKLPVVAEKLLDFTTVCGHSPQP